MRSHRDSKVIFFGILLYRLESKDCKTVDEIQQYGKEMQYNGKETRVIGFTSGLSRDSMYYDG